MSKNFGFHCMIFISISLDSVTLFFAMIKFAIIIATLLIVSSATVEGASEGKVGRLRVDDKNERRLPKAGKIAKVCMRTSL